MGKKERSFVESFVNDLLVAVEFGYIASEKGYNIQLAKQKFLEGIYKRGK